MSEKIAENHIGKAPLYRRELFSCDRKVCTKPVIRASYIAYSRCGKWHHVARSKDINKTQGFPKICKTKVDKY